MQVDFGALQVEGGLKVEPKLRLHSEKTQRRQYVLDPMVVVR